MDTSGFHRGGFCKEDRLIANITYIPSKYSDGIPSWEQKYVVFASFQSKFLSNYVNLTQLNTRIIKNT